MKSELFNKEIYNFLKNKTEVFYDMKNCNHHHSNGSINTHHEEGSVFNHTMLVVDYLLREYEDMLNKETIIAAYLHDYGKCFVREEKENKVRFFSHHNRALNETISIIKRIKSEVETCKNINIPFVLYLINFHMADKVEKFSPKEFAHKFKAIYKVVGTSIFNFIDQLFYIFEADNFGRIAENKTDISYYRDNHDKTISYISFITESEDIFNAKDNLEKEIEMFSRPICCLLIGPSSSGKSTYLSTIDTKNYKLISRDEIVISKYAKMSNSKDFSYSTAFKNVNQEEVNKELYELIKTTINNEENFIVDMTNCSAKARRKILSNLKKNYIKIAKTFVESSKTILSRNSFINGKNIPESAIYDMFNRFMLPTYDEFDKIEFINI